LRGIAPPPSHPLPSYVSACSHDHDSQERQIVRFGETAETLQCDRSTSPSVFGRSVYRFMGNTLTILVETSERRWTSIFDWLPVGDMLPSTSVHTVAASLSPQGVWRIVKTKSRRIYRFKEISIGYTPCSFDKDRHRATNTKSQYITSRFCICSPMMVVSDRKM
jgi:hypothetical protein